MHLWSVTCATLQEFKYWFLESSLHEPLKLHKEFEGEKEVKDLANAPHKTFQKVQLSSFPCDRCRNPARSIQYQCTDCDQGYCTNCWPRTAKRGGQLQDTDEQLLDRKHQSVQWGNLDLRHSAVSSSNSSPMQKPIEYLPLHHMEEGGLGFAYGNG